MRAGTTLLAVVITSLLASFPAPVVRAQPLIEFSQDGKNYSILHLVAGHGTAMQYYDYFKGSAHPGFGTPKGTATAAFYWDLDRHRLSLMMLAGAAGDKGRVSFFVNGLPKTTRLALSDNPGKYVYARNQSSFAAKLAYTNGTEGAILGRLEATPFNAKISIKPYTGLTTFRLADGDPTVGGLFRGLDLKKPVYIMAFPNGGKHGLNSLLTSALPGSTGGNTVGSGGTDGTPTPEPTSLLAWGMAAFALARRPQR